LCPVFASHYNNAVLEILQIAEVIAISPIVIGELLGGFEGGTKTRQNRLELQQFLDTPRVQIYSLTLDTAHFYGQIFTNLKRKGHPIPSNDLWIAAQALEHGCVVCTYDKHFNAIEGLIVGHSSSEILI
jgi:tRNA(fMet)-specific endonuclease VapC